jgi:hypothetical protein
MNTKLTLSIDKKTVGRAKKFAKERTRSLSNLVENYLKAQARSRPLWPNSPALWAPKG